MLDIDDILGVAGPFARHLAGFRPRKPQLRMAAAVAQSLAAREPLIVEAGTGTGKTFALAHLVLRLLSEGSAPLTVEQLLVVTFTEAAAAEPSK